MNLSILDLEFIFLLVMFFGFLMKKEYFFKENIFLEVEVIIINYGFLGELEVIWELLEV